MKKIIKKISISLFSVMGFSCVLWAVLFFNPRLSYANKTQIGQVTIFHNQDLDTGAEEVINNVIEILKSSELYDKNFKIQLCLNDDEIYPNLFPVRGTPLAHSRFNKTIIKNGEIRFNKNIIEIRWEAKNELRKYNLTWLLAHEFTHNLEYNSNPRYMFRRPQGSIDWKLEGYADYIARRFKNDGKLRDKIEKYLIEENNIHNGLPASKDEVGSYLIYSNYKYALIVQYLMEIKEMNFDQVCELDKNINEIYSAMLEWRNN